MLLYDSLQMLYLISTVLIGLISFHHRPHGLADMPCRLDMWGPSIYCEIAAIDTEWPLSRQCEIPWQFLDGSRHSYSALGMLSVVHIIPVLVLLSVVGDRNATVHDPKPYF